MEIEAWLKDDEFDRPAVLRNLVAHLPLNGDPKGPSLDLQEAARRPDELFRAWKRSGQRALEELPPMQKAVVTLHDVEGLDCDEICRVLEITEADARLWLHRGRSKLRGALERSMNAREHPRVI